MKKDCAVEKKEKKKMKIVNKVCNMFLSPLCVFSFLISLLFFSHLSMIRHRSRWRCPSRSISSTLLLPMMMLLLPRRRPWRRWWRWRRRSCLSTILCTFRSSSSTSSLLLLDSSWGVLGNAKHRLRNNGIVFSWQTHRYQIEVIIENLWILHARRAPVLIHALLQCVVGRGNL